MEQRSHRSLLSHAMNRQLKVMIYFHVMVTVHNLILGNPGSGLGQRFFAESRSITQNLKEHNSIRLIKEA